MAWWSQPVSSGVARAPSARHQMPSLPPALSGRLAPSASHSSAWDPEKGCGILGKGMSFPVPLHQIFKGSLYPNSAGVGPPCDTRCSTWSPHSLSSQGGPKVRPAGGQRWGSKVLDP